MNSTTSLAAPKPIPAATQIVSRPAVGVVDTPRRVVAAFDELFGGYHASAVDVLERTFSEIGSYDDLVLVRDIPFYSHCEHHMMPFVGRAHVAYLPHRRVVGISKLARVVDAYAKRLQIQEKMTAQIANTISDVLEPRGTAVVIEAAEICIVAEPPADLRHSEPSLEWLVRCELAEKFGEGIGTFSAGFDDRPYCNQATQHRRLAVAHDLLFESFAVDAFIFDNGLHDPLG